MSYDDFNEAISSIADVLALMAYVDAPIGEVLHSTEDSLGLWYECEEEAKECVSYFDTDIFSVKDEPNEDRGGINVWVYA